MRDSIYNNAGRRLSRLEGVQDALVGLGAKIDAQLANRPGCLANFRVFIYAFGIRAGSGVADMISMVRASQAIDLNSEIEKRRTKYQAQARACSG
jgi:hypothetical protein